MPHFGLMDERVLGLVKGPLQRARLHIRGGKRRLREGKLAAGIVTLYDALLAAMDSYASSDAGKLILKDGRQDELGNEKALYALLVRSCVLDGKFDFEAFDRLVETALYHEHELAEFDYHGLVAELETLMYELGVMPFDETALPPEDPKTF